MKTRWSLSFLPLWNSANNRTSSHPSSLSHRRSTFSTLILWSLVISLFCLVVPTLSHSLPFLYQRGNRYAYSRNIRPDPCVTKRGEEGVCMFAWDCMKANGTHLGTCIDRFYFGSCCKLDSIKIPTKPDVTTHPNVIYTKPVNPSTVKPSPIIKPGFDLTGITIIDTDVTNMTETETDSIEIKDPGLDNPEFTGVGLPGLDGPDITGDVTDKPTVSETTDDGIDKPTGSETAGEVIDKPTVSESTGMGMDKPTVSETTGGGIDKHTGSETTGGGMDKHTGSETSEPGSEPAGDVTDKPTVSETTGEGIDNPTGSETAGEVTDKTTVSETTGVGMDKPTGSETTGGGMDKHTGTETSVEEMDRLHGSEPAGEVMDKPIVFETTGVGMDKPTGSETIGGGMDNPTGSETSGEGMEEVDMTGSENTGEGTDKPNMTVSDMTGVGVIESEKTKPTTVDIGIQVSENDLPGVNGTGEENTIGSNTVIEINTAAGSTGINIKPNEGESGDGESDISYTTESPGIYGDGNYIDQNDVIDVGQIIGDSAIIDNDDNGLGSSDEATLIDDEFQVSSTESVGLLGIEPTTPFRPPSTDSPFETMLPQEPVTTFSPVKQPSKTDEDPSIPITVIPSAEKPVKTNVNKTDNDEGDDYIELTTFLPPVTDTIAVDQDNFEDKTPSIFTDFGNIPTEPSVITIKPKPDIETVTEISSMPEETTILGGIGSPSPLPGFPGINVIPAAAKPNVSDSSKPADKPIIEETTEINIPEPSTEKINVDKVPGLIIISTTTEPGFPGINVIPAAAKPNVSDSSKPTGKPIIEETTEINIPEPSTETIDVDKVPGLIIISTTTESEKPVDPITYIPVVSTKPTTKPEAPVTDDPTDWVPIVFPGLPSKPEPTVKPIVTSTENINTQVKPQEPGDEDEYEGAIDVAASTTIDTISDQNTILADRLNGSKYSEICGRPVYPTKRIVGGSDASFGEFPWQVSLRQWRSVTFLHKCGAALLNENWAVTAAHCVENVQPEQLLLRLGEFDLETAEEPYGFVERKVQIIATHPQFDARTFEYDLALLRFYEPIDFQPNVIPICIPQDDYNYIGETGFVSGWGRLYEDGPLPSIMQKVPVPVITNQECEAMYKVAGYVEHIPQIFICAGYEAGLKDSCEGDSGGPMVIQRDGVWNLAGVISWGIGCALPNQPGVYTRISAFREWIEKIIVF